MRSRVLLLPTIDDADAFRDVLCRTAIHLAHAEPESVAFVVDPSIIPEVEAFMANPDPPDDFTAQATEAVRRISPVVTLHDSTSVDREALSIRSDFVAVWDGGALGSSDWVLERSRRKRRIGWFDVDARSNRLEASEWAILGERLADPPSATEAQRFQDLLGRLPPGAPASLFGTGPSILEALDHDFTGTVRIVCNTVILDDDLMGHIEPQVVVCADPVFHFGPSRYAGEFRRVLRMRLAASEGLVAVVPLRYRPFLVDLMPEAEDRIIGVPMLPTTARINLDLRSQFAVAPLPNILTLLMLPFAATVAPRIDLVGFDGRGGSDAGFWEHGRRVQMHGLMPTVERLHPAFFDLDHDEYYDEHVTTVESMIQACEGRGIEVASISRSHMAPLARRWAAPGWPDPSWEDTGLEMAEGGPLVVSIDPDWVDDFGHYGPWFRRLQEELAARGVPAVSLTSRAMQVDSGVLPTFTHPTTNPDAAGPYARTFGAELGAALARLRRLHPGRELVMAFYTADTYHLAPIARIATGTEARGAVNLMRTHRSLLRSATRSDGRSGAWARGVSSLIATLALRGIRVTADTEEQAQLFGDLTGEDLPVWPMASPARVRASEADPGADIVVYCPSQPQVPKGIIEFAEAAIGLLEDGSPVPARFRMRAVRQPSGTSAAVTGALDRAARAGVEVIPGALDDAGYVEAIEAADIIVVPYRADPFRTRTSSVVVEAALAGKPVVVASGTWGARVAGYGGGSVEFRSGDAEDLRRAIAEAMARIDALSERARAAVDGYAERFTMAKVAEFLLADQGPLPGGGAEVLSVEDADLMLAAVAEGRDEGRDSAAGLLRDLHRQEVEGAIRRIGLERTADQLRRASAFRDERIEELESQLTALRTAMTDQNARIGELTAELREREKALAGLAETEALVVDLRRLVEAREATEAELRRLIADRDAQIAELSRRPVNRVIGAVGRRLDRS